jgi:AraC family transcriptional regulator
MSQTPDPPDARVVDSCEVGGIRFEEVRVEAGDELPWHDHPQTFINFQLAGIMEASWDRQVQPYSATVLPAGHRHRSLTLTDIHTFQVVVSDARLERLRDDPSVSLDPKLFSGGLPVHIARRMYLSFKSRDDLSSLDLETLLSEFWSATANLSEPLCNSDAGNWLSRAEEYLQANYARSIGSEEIARAVGTHPANLMRQFKRKHQITIGEHVRSIRIQRACEMLGSKAITFSEVAHAVGFADQSHFNRNFRTQLGVTPSAYMKTFPRALNDGN